ncbi:MAG TPA: hydrogen peroxide-inducible genes activator [Crenotrichaceae bacterium]|nr:hydrogen peroxide-inducible genes activator [Crenotrichaceae bacterium]
MAIKELEQLLQVQLIDRTNKSVTITPSGKHVVSKARLCLQELETLVEIPTGFQLPLSGKLTLGVIPTIAPYLLPTLLNGLQTEFPALKLYLKEQTTQLIYDDLIAGHIDLMLVALPYEFKHVEIMPLFKDNFMLACAPETRWLNKGKARLDQLKEDSVLLLEDGHCLREHTLLACKLLRTNKVNQFSATSINTLLHMVANDLGVTFIPEMAKQSVLLSGPQIEIHPLKENSYREIGLVWRKNSSHYDQFHLLGEFIRNSYQTTKSNNKDA